MKVNLKLRISNGSKKRCRKRFNYKGIGSLINKAVYLIEYDVNIAIAEFIYDYCDVKLYNVILFLLKENLNLKELHKFDYVNINYGKTKYNRNTKRLSKGY